MTTMMLMLHWYFYGLCLLYGNGLVFPIPPISVTGSGPHLWYTKIEYGKNCACKRQGGLEDAVGVGKGKKSRTFRRIRQNKYESQSKIGLHDPWDNAVAEANAKESVANKEENEMKRLRRKEKRKRGIIEYPRIEDIDPYDPSTLGFTEIGYILGSHGLRGELKVKCLSDFGELRLCGRGERFTRSPNRRWPRAVELLSGRRQVEDTFIVLLKGIHDRNEASALKGHMLYVRTADSRPPLEDGEFLVTDLVGLSIYTDREKEQYIGKVIAITTLNSEAHDVGHSGTDLLTVELPPLGDRRCVRQCYVPLVKEIVPEICVEDGWCQIDPPEGLLNLAVEIEERITIKGLLPPGAVQ